MRHAMTQTATILRPVLTGIDTYGDPIAETVNERRVQCWLNVTGTNEESGAANAEHADATVSMPIGTDIRSGDELEIDDEAWAVIGPPIVRSRPVLGPAHVEAQLRRRT
jgi:hypothetical protein